MSKYEVGDRVRLIYEGELTSVDDGIVPQATLDGRRHFGTRGATVEVIEKAKKPLRVGDIIRGEDAYEALPVGAVLPLSYGTLMRTVEGFVSHTGSTSSARGWFDARPVVYLPSVSA